MKFGQVLLIILIAMAAGYVGARLAPAGPQTEQIKEESVYERVMRTGVLRCGYGMYEPALFLDVKTGQLTGMMHEITEKIGALMSLKIEWSEEAGWSEMAAGLNAGRYDAICGGKWVYAPQGKAASYSIPVFFDDVHGYAHYEDFRFEEGVGILNNPDYSLVTIDGEISFDVAREQFPDAQRVELPAMIDFSLALENIVSKKADAMFLGRNVAAKYIQQNPGKIRQITEEPIHVFETAYMFKSQEPGMADLLNSALRQLHNEGFIDRMIEKYESFPGAMVRVAHPYRLEK